MSVVIDFGGGTVKYGLSSSAEPEFMPNCTSRVRNLLQPLVGDEIYEKVITMSQVTFSRSLDRGYPFDFQCISDVLHRIIKVKLNINPAEYDLVLTVPPFLSQTLGNAISELIFEDFGFRSYCRLPGAWCAAHESMNNGIFRANDTGIIVVDSGFSFTHLFPYVNHRCNRPAVQRINVGGKLLTNLLKETISYRYFNVMDEFDLINDIKEMTAFVSRNFHADMESTRPESYLCDGDSCSDSNCAGNEISATPLHIHRKKLLLPDHINNFKPTITEDEETEEGQYITLEIERFCTPEVLFHPSDVDIHQIGLTEAGRNVSMMTGCWRYLLVGGNVMIPGLVERFEAEMQSMLVCDGKERLVVRSPDNPVTMAWHGAKRVAGSLLYSKFSVRREAYFQHGTNWANTELDSCW